jgi:hypothetical protein
MGVTYLELKKLLTPKKLDVDDSLTASSCISWIFALAVVSNRGSSISSSYYSLFFLKKEALLLIPKPGSILFGPFSEALAARF